MKTIEDKEHRSKRVLHKKKRSHTKKSDFDKEEKCTVFATGNEERATGAVCCEVG